MNTAKDTNVSTDLTITGTTGARVIVSSDGTDATIPVATSVVSGVMSKATYDEHLVNTAKTGITTDQATAISTNTSNIATNATDILTNASGITTNATDIATNVTDIATNATIVSPALTGTPLAPTATAGDSSTAIATTAFVTTAVSTATSGIFVDLTTAQTIAGSKTFSSDISVNGDTYVSNSLYLGGTEITSTATELNLLTGATSLGTGILSPVTENSNTGVRLSTAVAANHGDIGSNAVDLSYSNSASTTRGATGDSSTAMGYNTTASGICFYSNGMNHNSKWRSSTAMGEAQQQVEIILQQWEETQKQVEILLQQWDKAQQQVEIILQQWDKAQKQVDMLLQQWDMKQQQVEVVLQQWEDTQQQVEIVLQQWEMPQQQVEMLLQQWDEHRSKWILFYSNGSMTTASDYGSLVIGQYNSSGSSATSADSFSTANTAFVIGNGADSSNISDAFSILFDGTTNIAGSVTATSFVGDGSGLTGITGSASSLNDLNNCGSENIFR